MCTCYYCILLLFHTAVDRPTTVPLAVVEYRRRLLLYPASSAVDEATAVSYCCMTLLYDTAVPCACGPGVPARRGVAKGAADAAQAYHRGRVREGGGASAALHGERPRDTGACVQSCFCLDCLFFFRSVLWFAFLFVCLALVKSSVSFCFA